MFDDKRSNYFALVVIFTQVQNKIRSKYFLRIAKFSHVFCNTFKSIIFICFARVNKSESIKYSMNYLGIAYQLHT